MRKCSKKNKSWTFDWCKTDPNPTRFHNTGWEYFRKVSIHGRRERLNRYGICIGFKVSNKTNNRLYVLSSIRQYRNELKNNGYFEFDGKWVSLDTDTRNGGRSAMQRWYLFDYRKITESCLSLSLDSLAYYNLKYLDDKMIYVKHAIRRK